MSKRRIPLILAHGLVVITAIGTICASLGLITWFILSPAKAEERLSGHRPTYFRGSMSTDRLDDYGRTFSVGHNSGASLKTTRQAVKIGADVIEIDVASLDGRLVSAHVPPMAFIGSQVFRGPSLAAVWQAAADADVTQLDLKESTPAFRALLFDFLEEHDDGRTVMVATHDETTLRLFAERFPSVLRFLSVPDMAKLERLYEDEELTALIDGVTLRYQLASEESVAELKERGLIVIAWTVNSLARVNEYVGYGVDGVSTDNLGIMGLLGNSQNAATLFATHRAGPETALETTDPAEQDPLTETG